MDRRFKEHEALVMVDNTLIFLLLGRQCYGDADKHVYVKYFACIDFSALMHS